MLRRHSNRKTVTETDATNALTIVRKNPIATRVAHSTPIRRYPCHSHSILRRLMPKTSKTIDEKVYESQKVTTTDATNALTIDTKNRIATRAATPTPIQRYPCHPHQMRRRLMPVPDETTGEKVDELQKVRATDDKRTYNPHKKSNCDTSRYPYANPKVSLSSSSNAASIDACAS